MEERCQKTLWSFFMYFLFYGVINIIANIYRLLNEFNVDPVLSVAAHHILASVNFLSVILCLNRMKFKVKSASPPKTDPSA